MKCICKNDKILFFDDSQLSLQKGVTQQLHTAEKYKNNPVLNPEKHGEKTVICGGTVRKEAAV